MKIKTDTILKCISKVQEMYIQSKPKVDIFEELLNGMIQISQSEYGFIGEVLYNDNQPYLHTLSITDISWTPKLKEDYNLSRTTGMNFTNLNTLFGLVISRNEIIISNNPKNDPRRGGYLKTLLGHPELKCFLGIPFHYADELIGMVGIANIKEGAYTDDHVNFLKPFTDTCSTLIAAYRSIDNQSEAVIEKENFFRSISHELRTPLNAIIGYTELIGFLTTDSKIKEYVERIEENNQVLLKLIDELLNYSKLNLTNVDDVQEINLKTYLMKLVKKMEQGAINNNIKVQVELDSVKVKINQALLEKIFSNLISNAIKFNLNSGQIIIKSKLMDDQRIEINILNTTNSITEEDLLHLGKPLYRSKKVSHIPGNGIGLSIVKKCLDMIKGSIKFRLLPGNFFQVQIIMRYDSLENNILEAKSQKPKVAYVDDQISNLRMMKEIFKIKLPECELIIFQDYGSFELELKNNVKYSLLLCDLGLPDISPKKLKIKLADLSNKLPIVIVTADVLAVSDQNLNQFVKDIITKPITIKKIIQIVNSILDS